MKLPSAEEYLQLVETKEPGSLGSLHNYHFVVHNDGKTLWYKKGHHSIVFKAGYNEKNYAVKFFLDDDHDLFKRYLQVQNYLKAKSLSWKVPFVFLDREFYPVLKMDWIEGLSFTQHLDTIIADPALISKLQLQFVELSQNLEANGIGHGDLNLRHISFVKEGEEWVLKLIDYDSLFISSLKGKDSLRTGSASFQHPMRITSDYSETTDRFSIWIFLTALEAFKTDPSLWTCAEKNGYDKSKELLFNFRDLAFPEQSRAFQILGNYKSGPLNFYTDKLVAFCNSRSLKTIEAPRLYEARNIATVSKKKIVIKEPEKIAHPVVTKPIPPAPAVYSSKPVEPKKIQPKKEAVVKNPNDFVRVKPDVTSPLKKNLVVKQKSTKERNIILSAVAALLVIASVFFIRAQSSNANEQLKMVSTPQKKIVSSSLSKSNPSPDAFFTSSNIIQFLKQLYQSYNSRDLRAILSNYSDNVKYYDAGDVWRSKLNGILQNLFIRPAYYEGIPDLSTLKFEVKNNLCTITITIHEVLQPDADSAKQTYASKIEYIINHSFKILSERNIN